MDGKIWGVGWMKSAQHPRFTPSPWRFQKNYNKNSFEINKPSISRRDFLKLTLGSLLAFGGLLGLGGLVRFLSYKSEPPQPT